MNDSCGSCSLCCKVMAIPELQKDDGVWCRHICKNHKGCGIYEQRPEICRQFLCVWRQSHDMPKSMRPDKCGVVFGMGTREDIVAAYVDPSRPNAWKRPMTWGFIERLVMQGGFNVVVSVVNPAKPETALKRTIFYPEGGHMMKVVKAFTPPDKDGVQWIIHSNKDKPVPYAGVL